jgi:Utp14 protein
MSLSTRRFPRRSPPSPNSPLLKLVHADTCHTDSFFASCWWGADYQNTKYLAGTVPHPFQTKEQYERWLSMPVGPEWSTREMFQKITKPRINVRAGAVVDPLQAPFK